MSTTGHRLDLPAAAAYFSEALWRMGDEEGSDRAAALALSTAEEIGAMHLLLIALEGVPAVAVRGSDTETQRTDRWHDLTMLLARRRELTVVARSPRVVLEEFGDRKSTRLNSSH